MTSLRKGQVPPRWKATYTTHGHMTLSDWVADFLARTKTLCSYANLLINAQNMLKSSFWLGGMFTPEAFITATRQYSAQVKITILILNLLNILNLLQTTYSY